MRVYKPKWKDAEGKSTIYGNWYIEIRDHLETVRRFKGFENKKATEELGRKLERLVQYRVAGEEPDVLMVRWLETLPERLRDKLAAIGVLDQKRVAAGKSLEDHIEDFKAALAAKGNTTKHVGQVVARVKRVIEKAGFKVWTDISPSNVEQCLADMREGEKGISIQTSNFHLQAIKQFCKWMVREGRASKSPIDHLSQLNVKTDQRHKRRALTADEIDDLLTAARKGPKIHGMEGKDRAMLYLLALVTGLRWAELRSLTASSFALDASPPTVKVEAGYSKRRREDVLPLREDTAEALKTYLALKLPKARAFPMWKDRGAEMLKKDLKAAKIEYETDQGYADFHSLRHSFITSLAQSGVHPKTAQGLARHSTITLTMDRYSMSVLSDQAEALARLPGHVIQEKEQLRATGTMDVSPVNHVASYVPKQGSFSEFLLDRLRQLRCDPSPTPETSETPQKDAYRRFAPLPGPFAHFISGTPSRTRTCDLRFRKPTLYPTELWAHTVPVEVHVILPERGPATVIIRRDAPDPMVIMIHL